MAEGGSKIWTAFSLASALTAAAVAKKTLDKSWTLATGKKPPENPADPDVEIWEAVSWAVASGVAVGLAKMLAQRRAASYYARSTGHLPPELQKDAQHA
ncbi:DUF4235 domain-containing protein [Nocardioides sp. YIM 152315]|uniref:DUF4235 domain-containing protein n=1 Tax=Nocardioides sp. YIM 152315 TaxID=3031760 RepID=UPI0023DA23FE|nr:DUF4235 domain-containing protein [Nocardioides sp. YIM 152315]MDF1603197.1 DUF4235 domain-containing protein [Nocardioides sp. YIM 152315]